MNCGVENLTKLFFIKRPEIQPKTTKTLKHSNTRFKVQKQEHIFSLLLDKLAWIKSDTLSLDIRGDALMCATLFMAIRCCLLLKTAL
jgi:hypothetical protein